MLLGFEIGQRWPEAVMHSCGSYFVPVPYCDFVFYLDTLLQNTVFDKIQLFKGDLKHMEDQSDVVRKSCEKAERMAAEGIELYANDFKVLNTVADILQYSQESKAGVEDEAPVFVVAGRVISLRRFGKAAFFHILDRTGRFQAYIQRDEVGKEGYSLFKKIDRGDYVGLKGKVFQTKTGEWTLLVNEFFLVSKAIRPLPEKFHGLKDPEKRYRQRYLDLIMNPEVRDIFLKRSLVVQAFRNFLIERDFCEVETPMMQPIPGGAEAKPFTTYHNALGMELFLRIAPELYLKRLLIGSIERVFEINRNFRNEGISTQHNPEFTMMEFYQAYATYEDLMKLTEEMFVFVAGQVVGDTRIVYQGNEIDFSPPWRRMTLYDALTGLGGVPSDILRDKEKLTAFALERSIPVKKTHRLGKILTKLFDVLVEPGLIQPTFITAYPTEISPLSRKNPSDASVTDRFELFISGREIANGFSELNDPVDQKERFLQQVADRDAGDEEAHYMDSDYIRALEYGMPPAAGEGVGIDRVVMLFTDAPSIREVIFFPHLKNR
jgi:lysyl-tRNA synthetase class 2